MNRDDIDLLMGLGDGARGQAGGLDRHDQDRLGELAIAAAHTLLRLRRIIEVSPGVPPAAASRQPVDEVEDFDRRIATVTDLEELRDVCYDLLAVARREADRALRAQANHRLLRQQLRELLDLPVPPSDPSS